MGGYPVSDGWLFFLINLLPRFRYFVTAVAYNPREFEPYHNWSFPFTGGVASFVVPVSDPVYGNIALLTLKCWGGGGGSTVTMVHRTYNNPTNATYASGGGGAFAQITFQVYDKDVLIVSVGGGGGVANGYVLLLCFHLFSCNC